MDESLEQKLLIYSSELYLHNLWLNLDLSYISGYTYTDTMSLLLPAHRQQKGV
jgi:hypothetical protein